MKKRALFCSAALAACLLSTAATLAAAPRPATAHASYSRAVGADGCSGSIDVTRAVETRLGRRVFVPAAEADLLVNIQSRRKGRQFVIDVVLTDRQRRALGRRRLTTRAAHCSALDDSLALVIALAVDVTPPSEPAPPEPPPSAPPTPTPPPALAAPPSLNTPLSLPPETPAPRAPWRLSAAVGPALALGALPRAAAGAHVRFELFIPQLWPLTFGATLFGGQRLGAVQGARFNLQSVQAGICPWLPRIETVELALCIEQSLGRFGVESFGFDEDYPGTRWLLAFGPSVRARYSLGQLFVAAAAALWVPTVQRRYFYSDGIDLTFYEPPIASGTGQFLVGVDF